MSDHSANDGGGMSVVAVITALLARLNPVALSRGFLNRVQSLPRPLKIWWVGAIVLVSLELSLYLSGLQSIGKQVLFAIDLIGLIPSWIGSNVGDVLGFVIGSLVQDLITLLLLFVFASFLYWFVFPWRVAEHFDREFTRRQKSYIDRGIITAVIGVFGFLVAFTPFGALFWAIVGIPIAFVDLLVDSLPRLTSRELIPNQGYQSPDGSGWEGTFLGLTPAQAWAIRVVLVYAYAFACLFWAWRGYKLYREHVREADWTPRDDSLRRFSGHYWGLFGFFIVFMFVVMAIWAPSLSPVPIEHNVYEPFQNEFQYLNEDGEVESELHGLANLDTKSTGQHTVGPNTYDQYGRYAPLGTGENGSDLFTNLAYGARTSLIIGLTAVILGGLIAVVLSLASAYYKGLTDILTIIASDTIISVPAFLLVMMLSVIFQEGDHPVSEPLDGGLLLALIFAFAFWPGLWRSIRGPSLQVVEEEWVDAAKSYGQSPIMIMRKHMAPYIFGYIMIYTSLVLGSIIIITAALSFLGLGISPPTPEWGRLIDEGQPYTATISNHVVTISGLMITLVVLAFNALGDGIRDAIDPEADVEGGAAAQGGGA